MICYYNNCLINKRNYLQIVFRNNGILVLFIDEIIIGRVREIIKRYIFASYILNTIFGWSLDNWDIIYIYDV